MPNHVTTVCYASGTPEDLATFKAAHVRAKDDGVSFDFETIIPMPESVRAAEESSTASAGFFALTALADMPFHWSRHPMAVNGFDLGPTSSQGDFREWLEKTHPDWLEQGARRLKAFRETGYPSWYEWSIANWGTKWGAYNYEPRESSPGWFCFKFETAWSFPEPIFRKLSEMYPGIVFKVASYDEGGNFGCEGEFNGANDYRTVTVTDDLYRRVYGREPEREEADA